MRTSGSLSMSHTSTTMCPCHKKPMEMQIWDAMANQILNCRLSWYLTFIEPVCDDSTEWWVMLHAKGIIPDIQDLTCDPRTHVSFLFEMLQRPWTPLCRPFRGLWSRGPSIGSAVTVKHTHLQARKVFFTPEAVVQAQQRECDPEYPSVTLLR